MDKIQKQNLFIPLIRFDDILQPGSKKIKIESDLDNSDYDSSDTEFKYDPSPKKYTCSDLTSDWQTNCSKLALSHSEFEDWEMKITMAGIYFNYVGGKYNAQKEIPPISIHVKYDMSVKVMVNGDKFTRHIVKPITSLSDLVVAMDNVLQAETKINYRSSNYSKKKTIVGSLNKKTVRTMSPDQKILNPRDCLSRKVKKKTVDKSTKNNHHSIMDDPADTILDKITSDEESLEPPEPPSKSKIEDGMLELFQFTTDNSRCVVVNKGITYEESQEFVDGGINVIHMSTDTVKKKRVILVGRDLVECFRECPSCNINFYSEAEAEDHKLAHLNGKIELDKKTVGNEIFKCAQCPAEFPVKRYLQNHVREGHKVERPFSCSSCTRRFKTQDDFKDHIEYDSNDSPNCVLRCKKCKKEFRMQHSYEEHIALSESLATCDIIKCKECHERLPRSIKDEHMATHPKSATSLLCPQCGITVKHLSRHMQIEHGDEQFACSKCDKIFNSRYKLTAHVAEIHEKRRRIICDKCGRIFKRPSTLRRHQMEHHGGEAMIHTCEKCGQRFKYHFSLKTHMGTVHEGVKSLKCDECGERFARKDYMTRHKKHHDEYLQNICPVCNTSFRRAWLLQLHVDGGHDDEGRPLYRRQTVKNGGVKKKKREFKSQKPKACPICKRVLRSSAALKIHYQSHLKMVQKKCPKCDMYFATVASLSKHEKRHDDPKYELRCRVCHIYKDTKEELKQHIMATHKNLKHKCEFCTESFGRMHQLTNHVRAQHPEEYEKRNEVLSMLVSQNVEDVPMEAYTKKKKAIKNTKENMPINRVDSVEHLMDKLISGKVEDEEETQETIVIKVEDEFDLFGQDYDMM